MRAQRTLQGLTYHALHFFDHPCRLGIAKFREFGFAEAKIDEETRDLAELVAPDLCSLAHGRRDTLGQVLLDVRSQDWTELVEALHKSLDYRDLL